MLKDLGLLVLRVNTGLTMAAHGYPKLFGGAGRPPPEPLEKTMGENFPPAVEQGGPANFASMLDQLGVPMPKSAAYASGLAEFAGGLALAAGFKTRLAALILMINLGVAIKQVHWEKGFFGEGGFEYPLSLWTSALTLFLAGPGALSMDGGGGSSDDEDDELL